MVDGREEGGDGGREEWTVWGSNIVDGASAAPENEEVVSATYRRTYNGGMCADVW